MNITEYFMNISW